MRSRLLPASSTAVLALVATGLAASPAAAQGSTTVGADWGAQSLVFEDGGGQANDLHVFPMDTGPEVRRVGFTDLVPLVPGEHCTHPDPADETFVACELPVDSGRPDDIRIFLGDGEDGVVTSDPGVTVVDGGRGDDELHAHTARLAMGGEGDDMVMADVVLMGGEGMDHLMGDPTDQVFHGGGGDDMIEAWDGRDIVHGSSGDDEISGGEGDDLLFGGHGDDVITGGGGRDLVHGGHGNDQVTQ